MIGRFYRYHLGTRSICRAVNPATFEHAKDLGRKGKFVLTLRAIEKETHRARLGLEMTIAIGGNR